jgi:hypothetical protein
LKITNSDGIPLFEEPPEDLENKSHFRVCKHFDMLTPSSQVKTADGCQRSLKQSQLNMQFSRQSDRKMNFYYYQVPIRQIDTPFTW